MNVLEYYEFLSLTPPVRSRVEEVVSQIRALCQEDMSDIFISEYVQQDGSHIYGSVWTFSKTFVSEGLLLQAADSTRFDVVQVKGNVAQIVIEQRHFDWNAPAADSSRLTVEVRFRLTGLVGQMQATGRNCEVLRELVMKYLVNSFTLL